MNFASLIRRWQLCLVILLVGSFASDAIAQSTNPRLRRRTRKYRVKIDSAPQRAAIYLDDKKFGIVGYTPWSGRLPRGTWKVILELKGYEVATKSIYVRRTRRTQETFIPLVKKNMPALLDIRAAADKNVFNAQVWLDGQLQGQVPVLLKVASGRHQIEIKKKGYFTFTQWVEVKQNDRVSINPVLKSVPVVKKGDVLVEADVPDAAVYIDGKLHPDKTPTIIRGVLEGPHVVEVKKAPAVPWKQTISVVANKTVKVTASLKGTIGGPGGKVRVIANVEGAKVFLDGIEMGAAPLDVKDLKPGEHVIEVRAPGYLRKEKRFKINAGQSHVVKFDLQPEAVADAKGKLKIVSKVPEAAVYVDGKKVGQVPQDLDLPPGDHFVVVEKKGFKKFETKVRIEGGQTITVAADLRAVGSIRFLSNPSGATVLLDSKVVGKTPLVKDDIDVGEHGVAIRYNGYYQYEGTVKIGGGKLGVINAKLEMIDTGPTPAALQREQKGLTSYSARTLPKGRSTIDVAAGYPYFLDGRITVGAGDVAGMGFDAGVLFRSYFSRSEIAAVARLNLADKEPFSVAVFGQIGGGSNFFDDSGRNSFLFDLGMAGSLTGFGSVTVTGRAYLNFWSDRHCPGVEDSGGSKVFKGGSKTSPTETCDELLKTANDSTYMSDKLSADDITRINSMIGEGNAFKRDSGVRAMVSVAVEIAWRQRWNLWGMVEGAPFQGERAAYTDFFNPALIDQDIGTYLRMGVTYKF